MRVLWCRGPVQHQRHPVREHDDERAGADAAAAGAAARGAGGAQRVAGLAARRPLRAHGAPPGQSPGTTRRHYHLPTVRLSQ